MDYRNLRGPACRLILALLFLSPTLCAAQAKPQVKPRPKPQPKAEATPQKTPQQTLDELTKKYPGLLDEFGVLFGRLQQEIKFPASRNQSRLLPLLPVPTTAYAAVPNYGDALRQALEIFRQELKQSSVLRDWWQHGDLATSGPKFESGIEKASQLLEYLGDEVVLSAATDAKEAKMLLVAEVRKQGLKPLLKQLLADLPAASKSEVRIVDPQELAGDPSLKTRPCTSTDRSKCPDQIIVLVRPDFVVAGSDLAALQAFNTRLDKGYRDFVSTPFAQRLLQAYGGGTEVLAAADLHTIIGQVPITTPKDKSTLQSTGFGDLKYAVWESKHVGGQLASESEFSFMAPRHGIASWLASPASLGSLDFVSPNAIMAATLHLKNPAEIFDDVKELSTASNPNGLATLTQMEQALNLSLRDDLLRYLGGEITFELDDVTPPTAVWRALLSVKDPVRVQQTVATLLQAMLNLAPRQVQEDGVTYYLVRAPSGKTTTDFAYSFVDGYLIAGPSRASVAEAIRLRKTEAGLARSRRYLDALPPGHSPRASAVLFRDPAAMAALQLRMMGPEMSNSPLMQMMGKSAPAVAAAYADETAIRGSSNSGTADVGVVAVIAAIAIPNLLRSRGAANEASAVGSLRVINVAQVTYASTYPERGFASTLEALGPDRRSPGGSSPQHAALVDDTLGCEDMWCTRNGYRFTITPICKQGNCSDYVSVGTPLSADSGTKNFCSTADGVIRFQAAPPLATPPTATQCRSWTPLQ